MLGIAMYFAESKHQIRFSLQTVSFCGALCVTLLSRGCVYFVAASQRCFPNDLYRGIEGYRGVVHRFDCWVGFLGRKFGTIE